MATLYSLPLSVAFFVAGLAVVIVLWQLRFVSAHAMLIRLLAVVCLCASLGIARVDYAASQFGQSVVGAHVGTEVTLEGVIVREPEVRAKTTHLYLQTDDTLILVMVDRYTVAAYGDTVTVTGTVQLPESFTTDFGRTFDYPGYLKAKGVEYTMAFAQVTVDAPGGGNQALSFLLGVKHTVVSRLELLLNEPHGALAKGLLLGMKEGLGEELERVFQQAGLTHIVVLSGYNIMLIVNFLTFLLAAVLPRRIRLVVGLCAIAAFALMVGLSATVVRATIMAGLFLIAHTFGRSYNVLRALLLAGMVMLLLNPYLLIYDIGFQLSFMATLGLILALPYFTAPGQPETIGLSAKGYVVSTIATQIAVLPLLLYHIGELSLVAVVVNVLALPMVPVAMLVSFLAVVGSYVFIPLGVVIGGMASVTLWYISSVAQLCASIPLASIPVPAVSASWVFVGYTLLGLLYYYPTRPRPVDSLKGWTIVEEK